jgi:hypothetical protein
MTPEGEGVEVRLNRPTFDFIAGNAYWNKDGLKEMYRRGVDFPKESILVKAAWVPDTDAIAQHAGEYHWQFKATHEAVRLVGFHMTSKILPKWLWATWKHESAPDPTNDTFGYTGGKRSTELDELFASYNVPSEWRHYRLIGTQTEFVDSIGTQTKLGNSAHDLEGHRAAFSSCVTCHAMARVDDQGVVYERLAKCCKHPACCTCADYPLLGAPVAESFEGKRQLDFVWAFQRIDGPPHSVGNCATDAGK